MTRAYPALSASLAIYEGPYDPVNGDVHVAIIQSCPGS